jgi:hypothetical protein
VTGIPRVFNELPPLKQDQEARAGLGAGFSHADVNVRMPGKRLGGLNCFIRA